MVSSTAYGFEELLDRVYASLSDFGYEVWCSHSGTMPTFSNKTAFANCLHAVRKCNIFLGIITPQYGTGIDGDGKSITHQELELAIELKKPRWLLAHDHVVFARTFLDKLGFGTPELRVQLTNYKQSRVFGDLRVIDMYNSAIRSEERELKDRDGGWVQKFVTNEDALRYTTAQFHRFQEVERFLRENFKDPVAVMKRIKDDSEEESQK